MVASLFAVGLGVGLFELGAKSLWYDEIVTARYARMDLGAMLSYCWSNDANGIAYYLLINIWGHVVGFGEGWLRLPSAVAAALAVPGLFLVARRYVADWAGVAAGLTLGVSSAYVRFAQEARPYAMAMLASVVLTGLLLRALDGRRWAWWAYAVVAAASVYVHLWIVLVLVAHVIGIALDRRLDRAAIRTFAAVAILAIPTATFVRSQAHLTGWVAPLTWTNLTSFGLSLAGGTWVLLVVALEAVAGVGWLIAYRSRRELWVPFSWAVVPVLLTIGISIVHSMLVGKYLITVEPAMALVITIVVVLVRPTWLARLALLGVLILSALTGWTGHETPKEDYRGAAAAVMQSAGPGDVLIPLPGAIAYGLDYYSMRLRRPMPAITTLDKVALEHPAVVWVVANSTGHQGSRARLEAAGYELLRSVALNGFTVEQYGRP